MIERILPPPYRIWPIHPQPLKDELLSSWLIRTAHANRFKVHDFYSLYFGRHKQIWNRDVDLFTPSWLIESLTQYFRCDQDKIIALTLCSYEALIFQNYSFNSATIKGILNVGIYHRSRNNFGLQYCPLCLKEDLIPYYRKYWRLAYITTCDKHNIYLSDRCPHCSAPIMPHRLDMANKTYLPKDISLTLCASCKKDLTQSIDSFAPTQNELCLMKKITHAIDYGYVELGHTNNLHSLLFFEGLRVLIHGLARVKKQSWSDIPPIFLLEKNPLILRIQLLKIVADFIADWPASFFIFLHGIKQPYTTFISKNIDSMAPYWVYQEFKQL